jgi:hypothetical protein
VNITTKAKNHKIKTAVSGILQMGIRTGLAVATVGHFEVAMMVLKKRSKRGV